MIVVADTSPLNYLIQIHFDDLLPRLYGSIVAPSAVMRELSDLSAPAAVHAWASHPPPWLTVMVPEEPADPELQYLGDGEREAIQISNTLQAELILIDERKGRTEARRRGFRTTGTLGVLLAAGTLKIIDAEVAYRTLVAETSFRTSESLEAEFITRLRSM